MRQLMLRMLGVLLLLVVFAGGVLATLPASLEGGWGSIDGGGGTSSGGGFTLSGTAGQADAGALAGGQFRLEGGFWHAGPTTQRIYLPLLSR